MIKSSFVKLEIYLPEEAVVPVREVLHEIGAGRIGEYDHCFSLMEVQGFWRPLENANPYLGHVGELASEREIKMEIRCPADRVCEAVRAVKSVHPYEEPVINVIPLVEVMDK